MRNGECLEQCVEQRGPEADAAREFALVQLERRRRHAVLDRLQLGGAIVEPSACRRPRRAATPAARRGGRLARRLLHELQQSAQLTHHHKGEHPVDAAEAHVGDRVL